LIADGPIVIFAFDRAGERASLGMGLDAGVAGLDVVHVCGIQKIGARRMRVVFAAWAVATLAAYVPLGDFFGVDVVADGVATVAERAGGTLHVVGEIERHPPVGAIGNEIGAPDFVGDVPLSGFGVVVVADFGEVALLLEAAVDERDIVLCEFEDFVGGEVGDDGVRKFAGIADDVSHGRFAPVFVNLRVAFLAGGGAGVASRAHGYGLLGALVVG